MGSFQDFEGAWSFQRKFQVYVSQSFTYFQEISESLIISSKSKNSVLFFEISILKQKDKNSV